MFLAKPFQFSSPCLWLQQCHPLTTGLISWKSCSWGPRQSADFPRLIPHFDSGTLQIYTSVAWHHSCELGRSVWTHSPAVCVHLCGLQFFKWLVEPVGLNPSTNPACLGFKMAYKLARLRSLDITHLLFGIRSPLILSTKRHLLYSSDFESAFHFHHFFHAADSSPLHDSQRHDRPFTTQAGRPSLRGYAASGCCSGTAVAKAGSSARRFSSEAKWGNLGVFTRWSLGWIYGIEIYWNILTYYWNDRDFQPTIEIIWVSSFGKECVSNHWKWSNMKALRFFKSLKQLGLKTIKCVYRMMRDMRRVLENMYINFYQTWWIWPSRIVEMSCYFF